LEKPKNSPKIQKQLNQKAKNTSSSDHVFTQGTFLQNYTKMYQVVSKIQGVTPGRTDG
jgi:hypothetical protein